MAADRLQAQRDLEDKLRLEGFFRRELMSLNASQLRAFGRQVLATGTASGLFDQIVGPLEELLRAHGRRVAQAFSRRVDRQLPSVLRLLPDERAAMENFLGKLTDARAATQASIIATTTQRQAGRALSFAVAEQGAAALRGELQTSRDVALNAAVLLGRMLSARVGLIVCFETQSAAEVAKQVEIQTLLGQPPLSNLELRALPTPSLKEWATVGDDRVRPAHAAADGIQVPVETPFTVGGQQLMYPGDTSLGASPSNVEECRCSSIPDVESIASARQDLVGLGLGSLLTLTETVLS